MAKGGSLMDSVKPEKLDMKIDGFDVEAQGLPNVTAGFAMINLKINDLEPEIVELVKISRKYLKLAILKAIVRHGGKNSDAAIHTV